MSHRFASVCAYLLVGCVLFVAGVCAQSTDATVSGTVVDPSGAHVVNVKVIALNAATGAATTRFSNAAGVYVFPALPPGSYRFTAEHPGFRQTVIGDVELAVGAQVTLNLALQLGQTTES